MIPDTRRAWRTTLRVRRSSPERRRLGVACRVLCERSGLRGLWGEQGPRRLSQLVAAPLTAGQRLVTLMTLRLWSGRTVVPSDDWRSVLGEERFEEVTALLTATSGTGSRAIEDWLMRHRVGTST
ncbi:MAG: hypothetical protein AAF533_20280 [Acidobacteriota bacterium]